MFLDPLAFGVVLVEEFCQRGCANAVFREQQLQCSHRIANSSRGVQARADTKSDVIRRHLVRHVGDVHKGAQTDLVRRSQSLQARPRQNAVLAGQRHHVGHCADRNQIEMFAQIKVVCPRQALFPPTFLKRVCQLERDADAGEREPRRFVVGRLCESAVIIRRLVEAAYSLRIHEGNAVGQFRRRLMMI